MAGEAADVDAALTGGNYEVLRGRLAASGQELARRAEARGLAEKATAMKALEGTAREHEEFRLRLEAERQIAIEQIKARVAMSESQAKVMAEAMSHADIKIVGGDGQFFDRFVSAVSLGSQIDGVVDSSEVMKKTLGDRLSTKGGHNLIDDVKDIVRAAGTSSESIKNLTVSGVLGNLMIKADHNTRAKLQALLDQARKLGVHDDKVS